MEEAAVAQQTILLCSDVDMNFTLMLPRVASARGIPDRKRGLQSAGRRGDVPHSLHGASRNGLARHGCN